MRVSDVRIEQFENKLQLFFYPRDIAVASKCFTRLVDDSCRSMEQLNRIFLNYVSKPCASASIAISAHASLLFTILSIFSIVS